MHLTILPETFLLASRLVSYPNQDWLEAVRTLLTSPNIQLPKDLRILVQQLNESLLDELGSEYLRLFDLTSDRISLYESEYGRTRTLFKTNTLADIAGFYRAFGFDLNAGQEMQDHISVELEFYALLQMKLLYLTEAQDLQGMEILTDAMGKFLKDHLGCFVPAMLERPELASSAWYFQVFDWVNRLIEDQCTELGVTPEQANWQGGQKEPDEMNCQVRVPISSLTQ